MARKKTLLGLGAAITVAVTFASAGPASADLAPSAGDAVGIGSDTVQNILDFVADGDTQGDVGFNSAGSKNRLVSFDATPDANDRAGYLNNSTTALPQPLTPTIVLRAGLNPVQRPNGSGSGITALLNDGAHNIDFVRMSRLPKSGEYTTAGAAGGIGALHVVKISTDNLQLAVASKATNAPATLTAAQIVSIYKGTTTDWSQVGGKAGTINPEIPQAGSGTGDTFRADLASMNGGSAVTPGPNVKVVEENDPSTINNDPNAVAPFSAGRKALYDSGYFNDPTKTYGTAQTPLTSGVSLLGGYTDNRGLYITFRNSDVASGKKFEPGSNLNLIQTLFYNPTAGAPTPFIQTDAGQAAVAAAGATYSFVDCGVNPSSC